MSETILVTGGAGFIGSHAVASALAQGHRVVVLDDLSRGSEDAVRRAERLGGGTVALEVGDLCDPAFTRSVLSRWRPDAVVHLAALKRVAESVRDPERYREVNIGGTEVLADEMVAAGLRRVVYASSGSVYGNALTPEAIPESAAIRPVSPYADTKVAGERALEARPGLGAVVHLRFFNVCGAHPSGQLGEAEDRTQNLMPVALCAARDGAVLPVFGTDWPTRDGTCIRDYIHVQDIVSGIEAARVDTARRPGVRAYNLGTGTGRTVLEVIEAVRRATGASLVTQDAPRRPGDPPSGVADASLARDQLAWQPRYGLDQMAEHAWRWMARPQDPR